MALTDVEGQSRAIQALQAGLSHHAVHHAWLFQGPDGVGKELAAAGLAQALCCPEQPWVGCGTCSSCTRVLKRNHPDVTWLLPEDEQVQRGWAGRSDFDHVPSRDIRVEQVRRLQERLAFRALESPHKVTLILGAHAMNPQAQNALLKTLEEPPRDTVLVLVTHQSDKLLPTIRSRCAKAQFGPLPEELIARKVKASATKKKPIDDATAARMAAMAGGSLSRALALDPDALAHRAELLTAFEALVPDDARGWLAFAESYGDGRGEAELTLELLWTWHRDVLAAQVEGTRLVNADLEALAVVAGQRTSSPNLHRRILLIDEAKNAISARNGAARLQLERMLIEMFSVAAAPA